MATTYGNNPKRSIALVTAFNDEERMALSRSLVYVGSAIHKKKWADYKFHPPVNPRAWKSLCDGRRTILASEAATLLCSGVAMGLFSKFWHEGRPKYVWSVDEDEEVYEAKIDSEGYHGYRLEEEDDFREVVLREWKRRCSPI